MQTRAIKHRWISPVSIYDRLLQWPVCLISWHVFSRLLIIIVVVFASYGVILMSGVGLCTCQGQYSRWLFSPCIAPSCCRPVCCPKSWVIDTPSGASQCLPLPSLGYGDEEKEKNNRMIYFRSIVSRPVRETSCERILTPYPSSRRDLWPLGHGGL